MIHTDIKIGPATRLAASSTKSAKMNARTKLNVDGIAHFPQVIAVELVEK